MLFNTMDHLGYTLNSVYMSVTLPKEKVTALMEACSKIIDITKPSIRLVARIIGIIVAAFPATQIGPLHYQKLQRAKIRALKNYGGHFDRPMKLPTEAIIELKWWKDNIRHCSYPTLSATRLWYYKLMPVHLVGVLPIPSPAVGEMECTGGIIITNTGHKLPGNVKCIPWP